MSEETCFLSNLITYWRAKRESENTTDQCQDQTANRAHAMNWNEYVFLCKNLTFGSCKEKRAQWRADWLNGVSKKCPIHLPILGACAGVVSQHTLNIIHIQLIRNQSRECFYKDLLQSFLYYLIITNSTPLTQYKLF